MGQTTELNQNRKSLFPAVDGRLGQRRLTRKDLSEGSGIPYTSLLNKLNGATEFTKSEMCRVRDWLAPQMTLDELFGEDEIDETDR